MKTLKVRISQDEFYTSKEVGFPSDITLSESVNILLNEVISYMILERGMAQPGKRAKLSKPFLFEMVLIEDGEEIELTPFTSKIGLKTNNIEKLLKTIPLIIMHKFIPTAGINPIERLRTINEAISNPQYALI